MSLIDRDEAYKVLSDYYHHKTDAQHKALKEALDRVPSAEPPPETCWGCNCPKMEEPKRGRWIDEGWYANGFDHHAYCCSKCGEHYIKCPDEIAEFNFCPNCGAKMEVEE